jgi:hypothetical protein
VATIAAAPFGRDGERERKRKEKGGVRWGAGQTGGAFTDAGGGAISRVGMQRSEEKARRKWRLGLQGSHRLAVLFSRQERRAVRSTRTAQGSRAKSGPGGWPLSRPRPRLRPGRGRELRELSWAAPEWWPLGRPGLGAGALQCA